jgi:hypothetical protein
MRLVVLGLAVLSQAATLPVSDPTAGLLALGVRQYRDGDFEAAVFSFDSAVSKLAEQPGRKKELASAYVYLGAAYVGLNHEEAAKGKFREALALDPSLELAPAEFSPRVVKLFDSQRLRQTAAKKKRGAKTWLIVGGLAAGAAVGISAATSQGKELPNRPPTADIGVSPEGVPLAAVTVMTFRATGSDPDGNPLTYRWTFGDGASATGPEVTHRFDREGSFVVEVSAEDGRGGSAQAQRTLTPRTLTGLWGDVGGGAIEETSYGCNQAGASFDCRLLECARERCFQRVYGTLADPRRIDGYVEDSNPRFSGPCTGEVFLLMRDQMRCSGTPFVGFVLGRK